MSEILKLPTHTYNHRINKIQENFPNLHIYNEYYGK